MTLCICTFTARLFDCWLCCWTKASIEYMAKAPIDRDHARKQTFCRLGFTIIVLRNRKAASGWSGRARDLHTYAEPDAPASDCVARFANQPPAAINSSGEPSSTTRP